jgi:hypothetical protein
MTWMLIQLVASTQVLTMAAVARVSGGQAIMSGTRLAELADT